LGGDLPGGPLPLRSGHGLLRALRRGEGGTGPLLELRPGHRGEPPGGAARRHGPGAGRPRPGAEAGAARALHRRAPHRAAPGRRRGSPLAGLLLRAGPPRGGRVDPALSSSGAGLPGSALPLPLGRGEDPAGLRLGGPLPLRPPLGALRALPERAPGVAEGPLPDGVPWRSRDALDRDLRQGALSGRRPGSAGPPLHEKPGVLGHPGERRDPSARRGPARAPLDRHLLQRRLGLRPGAPEVPRGPARPPGFGLPAGQHGPGLLARREKRRALGRLASGRQPLDAPGGRLSALLRRGRALPRRSGLPGSGHGPDPGRPALCLLLRRALSLRPPGRPLPSLPAPGGPAGVPAREGPGPSRGPERERVDRHGGGGLPEGPTRSLVPVRSRPRGSPEPAERLRHPLLRAAGRARLGLLRVRRGGRLDARKGGLRSGGPPGRRPGEPGGEQPLLLPRGRGRHLARHPGGRPLPPGQGHREDSELRVQGGAAERDDLRDPAGSGDGAALARHEQWGRPLRPPKRRGSGLRRDRRSAEPGVQQLRLPREPRGAPLPGGHLGLQLLPARGDRPQDARPGRGRGPSPRRGRGPERRLAPQLRRGDRPFLEGQGHRDRLLARRSDRGQPDRVPGPTGGLRSGLEARGQPTRGGVHQPSPRGLRLPRPGLQRLGGMG
jgi:hypothetical protein